VPLSPSFRAAAGSDQSARLRGATAGDDYQLLFTSALPLPPVGVSVTRIGHMMRGAGLKLHDGDSEIRLPDTLGWLHA
jgi:thiamine-monophosphate kinase